MRSHPLSTHDTYGFPRTDETMDLTGQPRYRLRRFHWLLLGAVAAGSLAIGVWITQILTQPHKFLGGGLFGLLCTAAAVLTSAGFALRVEQNVLRRIARIEAAQQATATQVRSYHDGKAEGYVQGVRSLRSVN